MSTSIQVSGSFKNMDRFLNSAKSGKYRKILERYGQIGVDALQSATPVDTGKTANSWYYQISQTSNGMELGWYNSNVNNGVNIAILIQTGHGTPTGGYVQGYDYINPSLRPIFDKMATDLFMEVNNG